MIQTMENFHRNFAEIFRESPLIFPEFSPGRREKDDTSRPRKQQDPHDRVRFHTSQTESIDARFWRIHERHRLRVHPHGGWRL